MLLGAMLAVSAPAGAQQLSPRLDLARPAPSTIALRPVPPDSASRRDFRWLGTAIGAAGLGLAAGLEAAAYCGNSENGPRDCTGLTIGVGLLGAAVGGALGHLIGRAIPRH
jgi:hypothetical protein